MLLGVATRLFKVSYGLGFIYTTGPLPQSCVSMTALVVTSNANKIGRCRAQFYCFAVTPVASEQMDFLHPS